MALSFGPRRATYFEIAAPADGRGPLSPADLAHFEKLDLIYRSLCALLFNYVPTSGHPGGSISSGRFVEALLFDAADYDLADPDREDADIVSYAAGHKAMGLYAMWALRDEIARVAGAVTPAGEAPAARRRPRSACASRTCSASAATRSPTRRSSAQFGAQALDGHPTPATPFVRLSTGASGVGVASSIGLAFGARDYYGADAPARAHRRGRGRPHARPRGRGAGRGRHRLARQRARAPRLEPGLDRHRTASAATASDARRLRAVGPAWSCSTCTTGTSSPCPTATTSSRSSPPSGRRSRSTTASPRRSSTAPSRAGSTASRARPRTAPATSSAPTASTRPSPSCTEAGAARAAHLRGRATSAAMQAERGDAVREECFWEALEVVRARSSRRTRPAAAGAAPAGCARRASGSTARGRTPRAGAPRVEAVYDDGGRRGPRGSPTSCASQPGASTTLRGELGRALHHLNRASGGALLAAAADLLGSTSVNAVGAGFPARLLERADQPRLAAALDRRHLRGRHGRHPLRHLRLRPPHRRRLVLRRLPRPARPHRRAPARHRRAGAARGLRRARTSRSSSSAPTPASRPARTGRRTPTRRRCSSCRRTSRSARRSRSRRGTRRRSGRSRPRARRAPGGHLAPFVTRPNETVLDRAGARPRAAGGRRRRRLRPAAARRAPPT